MKRTGKRRSDAAMAAALARVLIAVLAVILAGLLGWLALGSFGEESAAPTGEVGSTDPGAQATQAGQEPQIQGGLGSGQIAYGQEMTALSEAQEGLLGYMTAAYEALARLEQPDFSALFADPVQARANESAIALQIGLRTLTPGVDYSLTGYSYILTCREMVWREDGRLEIRGEEASVQNFAQFPGVDSRRGSNGHVFVLEETGAGWRLWGHWEYDILFTQLAEELGEEDAVRAYLQAAPEYLSQLRQAWAAREESRGEQAVLPQTDRAYDRDRALAYADRYAMERSGEWPDYSDYGGNCQNFASQCLLAGGIPMDTVGPDIWKWYDGTPSESTLPEGRSPSWSGVNQFRWYARDNQGFGLAALVDAPYYSGQPGDLIQMGTGDSLSHTVIIRRLAADAAGRTVDYLVHSNTNDMENYPASLYGYPTFSLIRIAGWNQG